MGRRKARGPGAKKGDYVRKFDGKDYVSLRSYKFKSKREAVKYAKRHRGRISSKSVSKARVTKEKTCYRVWARTERG